MHLSTFNYQSKISAKLNDVFDWHLKPNVFERLCPPWVNVKINAQGKVDEENSTVYLTIAKFGLKFKLILAHKNFKQYAQFTDTQISGPFAFYEHNHVFEKGDANNTTLINDRISFALPLTSLSFIVSELIIKPDFLRLFKYRERIIQNAMADFIKYEGEKNMQIAITGTNGLIGRHLKNYLTANGHKVLPLVRSKNTDSNPDSIYWNPDKNEIDKDKLEGLDCIIHLGGENIANSPWTSAQKEKIINSRVAGTRLLSKTIAELKQKPSLFICASAIGYYGDRQNESLDEKSLPGQGFLADLCKQWESACKDAIDSQIRVVNLRIGLVLSKDGGVLAKILPIFNLGGGGILGNGRQYMSWIAIDDILSSILHIIHSENISGPVNLVSPNPVTNNEFTKILGKVLHRPTIFPVPSFGLKLLLGQMADELLLASSKVYPKKLEDSGYKFKYDSLETALRHLLGR